VGRAQKGAGASHSHDPHYLFRLELYKSDRDAASSHRVTTQSSAQQSLRRNPYLLPAPFDTPENGTKDAHPQASAAFDLLAAASPPDMAESSVPSQKDGPVYFWKTNQEHGYLGQWFSSPWTHEGDEFDSAEKWMMVGKARLFGDEVRSP
jgi:hypothetical protein